MKDNRSIYILALSLGIVPLLQSGYFQDNYTVIKWLGVYLLASIAVLLSAFGSSDFRVPRFSRLVWILIGALFVVFIGSRFSRPIPLIQAYAFDRVNFIVLLFLSFNAFYGLFNGGFGGGKEKRIGVLALSFASALSLCIFLPLTVYQFLGCRVWAKPPDIETNCFAATFGNANMAAQFVGLATVFVLYGLSQTKGFVRWFFAFVSAASLGFIVLSQCRSVMLGMGAALALIFFAKNYVPKKWILGIIALAAGIVLLGNWAQGPSMSSRDKSYSSSERWSLLTSVIDLIGDKPLGVGQGGYEFSSVLYRMKTDHAPKADLVFKSPHNEFLRFVAEDGIAFGALMLALILAGLVALWRAWRNPNRKWQSSELFLMLSFGCVFGVEFLIQFPVENAYPFFAWSLFLGFILSRIFMTPESVKEFRFPRYARVLIGLMLLAATSVFVTSKYIEANYPNDMEKTHLACQIDQMNWRVCSDEAKIEVEGKAYSRSLETMKSELYKRPYNFPVLRMWGVMHFRIGDIAESCRSFVFYDRMFVEKSDIHQYVMENCASIPEMRAPFREAYESFIAKVVQ